MWAFHSSSPQRTAGTPGSHRGTSHATARLCPMACGDTACRDAGPRGPAHAAVREEERGWGLLGRVGHGVGPTFGGTHSEAGPEVTLPA